MAVRISPDAQARIQRSPGRVVVQVQGSSDPEVAALVLERAVPAINELALKGARDVERIPSGPFVMVVDRDDGRRRLRGVPELVADRLERAGVDGTVACIDHGGLLTSPLWGFPTLGPALICRLYPPPPEMWEDPPTGLPEGWLDEPAVWLTDGLPADHALWAEVGLVEFSLPAAGAAPFLEQQRRHRRNALVVAGRPRPSSPPEGPAGPLQRGWLGGDEPGRPIRALALCSSASQSHLALGAGGPTAQVDLPAIFETFTAMARGRAESLAYGFVDVSPTFLRFAGAHHPLEAFCDEAVFDGFPYQVLGPGHLERLGGAPPGARPIAAGRVEVSVEDLLPWMDEDMAGGTAQLGTMGRQRRKAVRSVLRPCLELDGLAVRQQREDRVKRRRLDLEDLAVPEYRFDPPER